MLVRDLFNTLLKAEKVEDVRAAHAKFLEVAGANEVPFGGRANNRGAIEVAADPARSLIERVTNGHDALLELEHGHHKGVPECRTPREAAEAWLGVPAKTGLAGLTPKERQGLAERTVVRLEPGEGWQSRILTVVDRGTGIEPMRMKDTILSLNESNKIQKHYLAGTYGQGGSSTLAFSKYVFIASRMEGTDVIAFTVVRYQDLPAEDYKTGRYVYLVQEGDVLTTQAQDGDFENGTVIRHFGYDLTSYTSSLGTRSLYGALQRIMFDPVAPLRFENIVAGWNRTIKGARNALNGALDAGDEGGKGPDLDYHLPMFNVSLGDHGDIGIEYWVLKRPEVAKGKKPSKPSRNFVDDAKPIVLSHNGQNQGEFSGRLISKEADLPFLQTQGRLIVHVSCDRLSPTAKRQLFSSTREQAREGYVQTTIQQEVISLLKSDDELKRLNEEAREKSLKEKDDDAQKQMQRQVAKLLRLVGPALVEVKGDKKSEDGVDKPTPKPRQKPEPIDTVDPPTFIRIVADQDEAITFFAGQRRYIRIETDANSSYHDPDDAAKSRINIAVADDLEVFGTSPLQGGRMRIGVLAKADIALGSKGSVRIELYRPGHSALSDERDTLIVDPPTPKEGDSQSGFPQFEVIPVDVTEDENWELVTAGDEDGTVKRHASAAQMNEGTLYIYYSTKFSRFAGECQRIASQNPALLASFIRRYELWLAVHALLAHEGEQDVVDMDEEAVAEFSRQERCRLASIAAMVASQEVRSGSTLEEADEAA
ncbi:MAG: hypothetical protein JHD35_01050 [Sphingopyxis sp.]|nr:hypothetical protein [Sphingopyxis sp.]